MSDDRSTPDAPGLDLAVAWLTRRPLSEAELRERLTAKGRRKSEADAVCAQLRTRGWLDDERLAVDFIVARSERLGHGRTRLIGDLVRRGVQRAVAESAWTRAVEAGDVAPSELLRRKIARKLAGTRGKLDRREYARVYNALLRAGFDDEEIRRELDTHGAHASLDEPIDDGMTDDFA